MGTIIDLKKRLSKLDIGFEAENAIEATKDDIISRQKDQMLKGFRADGSMIGKYKNAAYAKKKNLLNPLAGPGNMDWKLTGSLYNQIFVDVREDIFVIDSADEKTGKLIESFGDPFGLTQDNQSDYVEEKLRPQFMEQIREVTGL